jgi:uncharacterized protein YecE (DUF72 family)
VHFGRVDDPNGRDTALPAEAPRTQKLLGLAWGGRGRLHAGAPVWVSDTWVGSLYPAGTKPPHYLGAYAQQLGTVELSSTFYQQIDPARMRSWAQRAREQNAGFRFCPKVFRGITEHLDSPRLGELVAQCAASFAAFEDTYGLGIAQFPETFAPQHLPLLDRFLQLWPRTLPLAVELRHPGWFQSHVLLDDAVNLLYRHGAATVITDTLGRRDALHMSLSQPRVLIRFLGSDLAPSDRTRLTAWSERLIDWAGRGLQDLYFFCHQPTEATIPKTVNLLLQSLQMRGLVEPAPWRDHAPRGGARAPVQRSLPFEAPPANT